MKKVLLVTRPICPPWDEASKNFAYQLATHIENFEMHVLSYGKLENLPSNVRAEDIYNSKDWSAKEKLKCLLYQWRARKKYDIIHYLFTATPFSSALIETFAGNQHAKTIQTIATLRDDLHGEKALKKMFFADKIITYSDYACQKLEKLNFKNVERIYPGIDLEHFKPQEKDEALLLKYGLQKDDFAVMYPGEYTRLGATGTIIKMILEYFERNRRNGKMKFIFANRIKNEADRKKEDEIKMLLHEKDLEDKVVFTGTVSEMDKLYNIADVVVFPAENMFGKFDVPLAVIESYACGKPVILSDLEIFREFSNDDIAVVVKKGDAAGLLGAVENLEENKQKRDRLGRSARTFIEQNFNIERAGQLYKKIYESLI